MFNLIEKTLDYLYYDGGFELTTGYQTFSFRVRKDSEIEIIADDKKVYAKEPDIYQFFAFVIFCEVLSSEQKTFITSKNNYENVSKHNLKALNKVYNIYKTMLQISGEDLVDALTNEDIGELQNIFVFNANEAYPLEETKLKYDSLKERLINLADYFVKTYEYYDNVYDVILTTEDYEKVNVYARMKWDELESNKSLKHPGFFTKDDILYTVSMTFHQLERDLDISNNLSIIDEEKLIKVFASLAYYRVDILDIIFLIKCAFSNAIENEREYILIDDFIEAIELSYLSDEVIDKMIFKLDKIKEDSKVVKLNNNVIKFPGRWNK